jgi:hypothetical protein
MGPAARWHVEPFVLTSLQSHRAEGEDKQSWVVIQLITLSRLEIGTRRTIIGSIHTIYTGTRGRQGRRSGDFSSARTSFNPSL